jgi:hypothetical protein
MKKVIANVGDTLVLRNGDRMVCVDEKSLTWIASFNRGWAIYGIDPDNTTEVGGPWQNWNEDGTCERGRVSNFDIIQVIPAVQHFAPEIGDTIVTAERGEYTCVPLDDLTDTRSPDAAFKGVLGYGFSRWKSNGYPASQMVTDDEIMQAYRVVKIIKKTKNSKNPASNPVNNLEFRVRVLEKENEILTRLLMKEGKL